MKKTPPCHSATASPTFKAAAGALNAGGLIHLFALLFGGVIGISSMSLAETSATGDQLVIGISQQAAEKKAQMALPGKGMSMSQVRSQFGSPTKVLDATGKPPITTWIYPDYSVYFEHEYVIHAVLELQP